MARILIVEDDPTLALSLRIALSNQGHEPMVAGTLEHASQARRRRSPSPSWCCSISACRRRRPRAVRGAARPRTSCPSSRSPRA
ncbi:MAG: hypothetical protein U1F43_17910 [Myxococcota bacterium]